MDRDPQFAELPTGRRLAYVEYGDPAGMPVVYCHGYPSSRREALLLHEAAVWARARIIAPDRPGYGDSDALPERSIADWPQDVSALADHLGLRRFALLGVSGGGPYALACAWRIPERLSGIALICPLGPIYLEPLLNGMNWAARVNLSMARHAPLLSQFIFGQFTMGLLAFWPESVEHLRTVDAPESDRIELEDPYTRRILNQSVKDAIRGVARGALQDLTLYTQDWGIPFADIQSPIQIWHGLDDGTVPVSHSRWYALHLPNTETRLLPEEGHFSLPLRHSGEILSALLAPSVPQG